METNQKITNGAVVILLIASIVMGASLIGQKNVYVCLDNQIAMVCDSLSKINANGLQTRCYSENKTSYKICNEGWIKFENNVINSSNQIGDYVCNNQTFIKECKSKTGGIILRIKSE